MRPAGPGADPSVSPGGSEGAAWYVSPSKTNGQEVRPQKQQYLENLYSEKKQREGKTGGGRRLSVLMDEPVYFKDAPQRLHLPLSLSTRRGIITAFLRA